MSHSPLTPLNVPALLRRFNLHPRKSLGQNFLIDETALGKVVAAGQVKPGDTVLEIGPGLGSLTRHLAAAAQRVVAVEVDAALLPVLELTLQGFSNVELIHSDILRLDLVRSAGLQPGYKVVANIPYYITSAVIRHLLEAPVRPDCIVLTIQREVAERIVAEPGDMSLLAVSVQFYSTPRVAARLPAGAFYPRPDVDSAVVRLDVHPEPIVPVSDTDLFFRVARAGFSQKRKQLRNSLSGGLRLENSQVDALLAQAGIAPQRRAETLSLDEWARLTNAAAASGLAQP
jgi:16S rRNA (adenine1518-N6/adenine1519-N6)-dimethyltransferase